MILRGGAWADDLEAAIKARPDGDHRGGAKSALWSYHPPISATLRFSIFRFSIYCQGAEAICAAGTVEARIGLLSTYNPPAISIKAANSIVAIAATSSSNSFIANRMPPLSPFALATSGYGSPGSEYNGCGAVSGPVLPDGIHRTLPPPAPQSRPTQWLLARGRSPNIRLLLPASLPGAEGETPSSRALLLLVA